MSALVRRASTLLVTAAATVLIVVLSRSPWPQPSDHALVRLSWSGRPERIERCRELSEAELEKLPAHMRRRVECEGHSAHYLVRVWHDGALLSEDTVTGGGLRGDRAIHMLREYPSAPGTRRVAVEVAQTDSVEAETEAPEDQAGIADTASAPLDRARRERQERRRERLERLPPLLRLDTTLRLAPGEVAVVTYAPIGRRLLVLTE